MPLWIPEREQARRAESRERETAMALRLTEISETVKRVNHELRKIDPYCEVFKAPPNAQHPGVKPGRWHVLRRPPAGQPTFIVHEGPNGEYLDLDSSLFARLRAGDMWNAERQREREKAIRKAKQAEESAKERERAERVEEIMDRAHAAWNPGVSFANQGSGWKFRAGARKGDPKST